MAFDIDTISYCRKDLHPSTIFHQQLRSPYTVTAFCKVDEYDLKTRMTKEGSSFMRYLLATETGELFMLAFHLDALNHVLDHELNSGGNIDSQIVDQLMTIEFLA